MAYNYFENVLGTLTNPIGTALDSVSSLVGIASDLALQNSDDDLMQSSYDFQTRMFPSNLDMNDLGHYMIININVPVSQGTQRGSPRTRDYTGEVLDDYSKVDVLRFSNNLPGAMPGDYNAPSWSWPRSTRRIRRSIAIQMPTPMMYTTVQRYEEISLTAMAGGGLGAIASGAAGALTDYATGLVGTALGAGNAVRNLVNGMGDSVGTISGLAGYPINPRVEIIFSNIDQRQFAFEVLMTPKSHDESIAVRNIIRDLRFFAAPELDSTGFGAIPLYIPPAEFDLSFFTRGEENTNIPRINTCVLERIEVDYAPSGIYASFRNGHPVAVRLSLGFREIEPLHKLRILQGF